MKSILLFLFLVPVSLLAQNADSAWIVANYVKKEMSIPMRDGKKLFTAVYLPKDQSEKHPLLITRTPYSCAPYGESNFKKFWLNQYKAYLKENYIMIYQDVRGKYMSEGEYMDVRPFNPSKTGTQTDEASDTYDTIDWLIKNLENNNGRAGVFGISYPGFYSTQAAVSNHPALMAVSPQAPVTEWFIGDDFHHNGAFMLMDAFAFYVTRGFGTVRPMPTTADYNPGYQLTTNDNYGFYLSKGALPNFTKLTGDSIGFWNDLMAHPNYDEFWKKRNARAAMKNVKPAMLVVGGLYDAEDCYGAWNLYKAIEKQSSGTSNRLVMGPWSHGQWGGFHGESLGNVRFGSNTSEWYFTNVELPFFNFYLKGKGDEKQISEATIFFSGSNEWKKLESWPVKGVKEKAIYLQPKGKLGWEKNGGAGSSTKYTSDPEKPVPYSEAVHSERTAEYMLDDQRFAARRPDVLVFSTDSLEKDVTLGGPLTADLSVSITGTDADFVVKLIDVFPDDFKYEEKDKYVMNGYQMLVRGEVFRGRYRNSFEKPEAFVPGKVTKVKFVLPDVAHTFKKGHKIMVQVQSSWFPLVDRNPQRFVDIYHASDKDFQKAEITIFHDKDRASAVWLPVVE